MLSAYRISKIKVTKEEYLEEIVRVAVHLNTYPVAPKATEYNRHCKPGYSAQRVRNYLRISYTQGVKLAGLQKRPKDSFIVKKNIKGKIKCGKEMISLSSCVPGNRPDCPACEGMNKAKVKATPDISVEEAKLLCHNSSRYLNGNEVYMDDIGG